MKGMKTTAQVLVDCLEAEGGRLKIRGQPARSPKGLVVSSPHHAPNLPSPSHGSQHLYIQLRTTSLPNFDHNSHVNHHSAATISAHQDHVARCTP